MRDHLAKVLDDLPARPSAIVVVSAHWETDNPTLSAAARPSMIYDYSNFPEHTYRLKYPAPGDPSLAGHAQALLANNGIVAELDPNRGYDHGVFVPMLIVDPTATIPVVSMSIQRDMDPGRHLAIGRALEPLRSENVLIIGSGNSFHNTPAFFRTTGDQPAHAFDAWLTDAVEDADTERRSDSLVRWESAPGARSAQPEEDHLIPLMVAAGAAGEDVGHRIFHGAMGGKPISAFRFG